MATKSKRQMNRNLSDDARELGRSLSHLWRVIHGERESPQLLKAYLALKRSQRARKARPQTEAAS